MIDVRADEKRLRTALLVKEICQVNMHIVGMKYE